MHTDIDTLARVNGIALHAPGAAPDAEALRQRHTHLRLAAGRGPHHADDLVVHVLTSIRFGKRRSAVMACKVVDFSFCR